MGTIAAGLSQGLAFLPYTVEMTPAALDQALRRAGAVSLNDAYRAAFGVSLAHRRVRRTTGAVRGRDGRRRSQAPALAEANRAFHRLLVSQGMSHETARKYVLVGNEAHAATRGQVLRAVVLRHMRAAPFRARDPQTNVVTVFRPEQDAWFAPFERDVDGQPIDEVMDWAALEAAPLGGDKVLAVLLVLAAEAVKFDRRTPEYWHAERRWLAGETAAVMQQSVDRVRRALAS
jgi:hypothetical protein